MGSAAAALDLPATAELWDIWCRPPPLVDRVDLRLRGRGAGWVTSVAAERVARVLDEALLAQGVDAGDLGDADLLYAEGIVRSLAARLGTRHRWEEQLGGLASHAQVLTLTGWTKQALSQAVADHRVLKLTAERGHPAYLLAGFDDDHPARPLPGLAAALLPWAGIDPAGWAAASWFTSPQVELAGQTPRKALLTGEPEPGLLARLAGQAAGRLGA